MYGDLISFNIFISLFKSCNFKLLRSASLILIDLTATSIFVPSNLQCYTDPKEPWPNFFITNYLSRNNTTGLYALITFCRFNAITSLTISSLTNSLISIVGFSISYISDVGFSFSYKISDVGFSLSYISDVGFSFL